MFKDSKARFEKAKVFPFIPTGEYYFDKGIKAYDRFDINKAIKYLKRAWELEPLEPMIACQLAIVYTEAGEYKESNKLLYKILQDLDPHMTECHYFLANNFAHIENYTEAIKHANRYLELDRTGEFAVDAEELLDILEIDGENLDELTEQDEMIERLEEARHLLEETNFAEAIELLEQTVLDYPEFWPAYNNLALAYFYEGETGKASGLLEKVLENNPGNLHALCNLAVFLFYEKQFEQLDELLNALEKVQPLLLEHRYKLGATFALTGRYDQAYYWLNQIKKYGFNREPGYYYWLAKSAFYTNHHKVAESAWEELKKINPKQANIEPWKVNEDNKRENDTAILRMLRSNQVEERLYGIFLISISDHKHDIVNHPTFKQFDDFSLTEKAYLAYILQAVDYEEVDFYHYVEQCHHIATLLYNKYKDTDHTKGLICSWFAIFLQGLEKGESFKNGIATAAAVEYNWCKQRNNKKTQKQLATEYGISVSSLSKYIHIIDMYWK